MKYPGYQRVLPPSAVEKMQGDAKPGHNPKARAKLFHAFAAAGQQLADLHVNYESAKEFPLPRQENKAVKLDWRVEAMKLVKEGTRSTASQNSPKRKSGTLWKASLPVLLSTTIS